MTDLLIREECFLCHRREGEITVDFEGRLVSCCGTCWERIEDERYGFDGEAEE